MECRDIQTFWDQWSCRFSELPDSSTAIRTAECLINVAWLLSASLAILLLQNQWWTLGRVEETWRTPFFWLLLHFSFLHSKLQVKDFPHFWAIGKFWGYSVCVCVRDNWVWVEPLLSWLIRIIYASFCFSSTFSLSHSFFFIFKTQITLGSAASLAECTYTNQKNLE